MGGNCPKLQVKLFSPKWLCVYVRLSGQKPRVFSEAGTDTLSIVTAGTPLRCSHSAIALCHSGSQCLVTTCDLYELSASILATVSRTLHPTCRPIHRSSLTPSKAAEELPCWEPARPPATVLFFHTPLHSHVAPQIPLKWGEKNKTWGVLFIATQEGDPTIIKPFWHFSLGS